MPGFSFRAILGELFLIISTMIVFSFSHDHGVFSLGVVILVLSLASVWWLQKNAPIIFGEPAACQENPPVNM